jgi:DNA (cytosine-5)-methyltransferase 1
VNGVRHDAGDRTGDAGTGGRAAVAPSRATVRPQTASGGDRGAFPAPSSPEGFTGRTGTRDLIVHGFAGIGWSEALRAMSLADIGLELADAACRTRAAAGHATIRCDVANYPTQPFRGRTRGGIWSPPCPGFGKSGKKLGLIDLPHIYAAIDDLAAGRDTRAEYDAQCLDRRSILTAEPMRWIHDLHPEWIAMEQVPSVLPVWEHYAGILRARGYSVATGAVDAAGYGLGSHRPRAVLLANRTRKVALPPYTHGPGRIPYTTMADTIGWGYTDRPAPTVTSGGTSTGGAEPFGNGSRQAMRRAIGTPRWADRGIPHLRPTLAEAMALNGLRPDLAIHGNAGQSFTLVGNVVPPPMARALLEAAIGPLPAPLPVQLELDLQPA